jgi:hypothetical protein
MESISSIYANPEDDIPITIPKIYNHVSFNSENKIKDSINFNFNFSIVRWIIGDLINAHIKFNEFKSNKDENNNIYWDGKTICFGTDNIYHNLYFDGNTVKIYYEDYSIQSYHPVVINACRYLMNIYRGTDFSYIDYKPDKRYRVRIKNIDGVPTPVEYFPIDSSGIEMFIFIEILRKYRDEIQIDHQNQHYFIETYLREIPVKLRCKNSNLKININGDFMCWGRALALRINEKSYKYEYFYKYFHHYHLPKDIIDYILNFINIKKLGPNGHQSYYNYNEL